jgi:hypothetical protein
MADISHSLKSNKEDFIEGVKKRALKLEGIHQQCMDKNTPSTLTELFQHYQPHTDYNREKPFAVCDGCGIIYQRPYNSEELAIINKERQEYMEIMQIPMTF